jgi:hypothetical protein
MRLIQVLAFVLTELSVGMLLLTAILPPREIRTSFFSFNSLLAAIAAALALLLVKFGAGAAWWDVRYLGLTVIGATLALGFFKLEKTGIARLCLMLSGLLGLAFGLMPLAERMLTLRGLETRIPLYFDASALAGAALLGAVVVGTILGHWYLVMRRLSFEHLELFAKLVMGTGLFRGFILIVILGTLKQADPKLAEVLLPPLSELGSNALFFLLRMLLGIGGPLVLGYMVLRCVREQNNQAATGLLYIAVISVLFGEMLAALLLV